MKILFLSDYYPPYVKAGAEVSTSLLASWLARNGNTVSVACSKFADSPWTEQGVIVYPIIFKPLIGSGGLFPGIWRACTTLVHQITSTIRVLMLIRKLQPDIINAVTYSRLHPIIIGVRIFSRRPIVIDCRAYDLVCPAHLSTTNFGKKKEFNEESQTRHGYRCVGYTSGNDASFLFIRPFAVYESFTFNLYKYTLRYLVNHFDGMMLACVSKYVQHQLVLNGFKAEKTTSIYNISQSIANNFPHEEQKVPMFAYGGRIEKDKGVWDIVAAVEILRRESTQPFMVTIAGKGGAYDSLKTYIEDNHLGQITLLGHIKPEEVLALYGRSVAVLAPSRWPEPFGRFILDAISVGRPVITTRTGGSPEGVKEGVTGFLVDPGNPEQLSVAMKYFIENPIRSSAMKSAIVEQQKYYQGDVIGQQRLALYKKMLGRSI